MIDLMAASNAYEANLTALGVVKAMINKTLEMGK
ncbi:MAG: flagellar basal body rod protein FlgC, partial [Oscillospiraceae bacterium]